MRFLNELHEGDRINGIYLCKQKQSAVTKNGKPYENIILQDKTGIIDGKIWDPNSLGIDDFDALDYIDVVGDVTSFAGAMQLNIKRVRKAAEDEYNPADYLPVSENSTDDMYTQLVAMIGTVKNTYLNTLLKKLFIEDKEFLKSFEEHSAAKTVHHGFIGGLMEHTLSVARLCDYMFPNIFSFTRYGSLNLKISSGSNSSGTMSQYTDSLFIFIHAVRTPQMETPSIPSAAP